MNSLTFSLTTVRCWNTVESRCLGLVPFVVTHFIPLFAPYMTFCGISMRPCGWRVGLPHYSAVTEITPSPVILSV
jgi:hypothetical protein